MSRGHYSTMATTASTTTANDDKYKKENYLVHTDDMAVWRRHPNYMIVRDAAPYIRGRVADVGCNIGIIAVHLSELPMVTFIHGFDINAASIAAAHVMAERHGFAGRSSFDVSDFTRQTRPELHGTFDTVVTFHTLEHIYQEDLDAFVQELANLLRPGGNCMVLIPFDHAYPDPCHVSFFKEADLIVLFERHGLMTRYCFKDDRYHEKDLLHAMFVKVC